MRNLSNSLPYFLPTLLRSEYPNVAGVNLERNLGALRVDYIGEVFRLSGVSKCCYSTTRFSRPASACSICGERLDPLPQQLVTKPSREATRAFLLAIIEVFAWAPDVLTAELLSDDLHCLLLDSRVALHEYFQLRRDFLVTVEDGEEDLLRRFSAWRPGRDY